MRRILSFVLKGSGCSVGQPRGEARSDQQGPSDGQEEEEGDCKRASSTEDVVDLQVPKQFHKKGSADPCEKTLTERQLLNIHVKIVEMLCRSAKDKETWATARCAVA